MALALPLLLAASGCASSGDYVNPQDPWEGMNRSIYKFNTKLDEYAFKPVAKGYRKVVPGIVRTGVTNFFDNLRDWTHFANALFQLKFDQALDNGARVVWNTTAGIGGLLDVATPMGIPQHEQDLGLTFARYGVPKGPYLMLPFFGPSTLRDGTGEGITFFITGPETVVFPEPVPFWSATTLKYVNKRSNLLDAEKVLEVAALDKYSFLRDAYLQRRRALEYDGNPPPLEEEEGLLEDEFPEDPDAADTDSLDDIDPITGERISPPGADSDPLDDIDPITGEEIKR